LIHGGGQERGLRSGTVPAPLTVGLGEACRIAKEEMALDHKRVKELSDRLVNGLTSQVEHIVRNGDPDGYAGCVNLSFSYVEGESLLMALKVSLPFLLTCYAKLTNRTSPSHPDRHAHQPP
jgi:cysteine desulfurase